MYTVSQKMSHFVISVFLLHINRLLKFFHRHIPRTIGNKVILHHILSVLLHYLVTQTYKFLYITISTINTLQNLSL